MAYNRTDVGCLFVRGTHALCALHYCDEPYNACVSPLIFPANRLIQKEGNAASVVEMHRDGGFKPVGTMGGGYLPFCLRFAVQYAFMRSEAALR